MNAIPPAEPRLEADTYRNLQLLDAISSGEVVSQRTLARRLGIAVGLTNLLLRRMAVKGFVKVVNVRKNRLRYLVTPRGIAEKTRLTYEYFEYSLYLYRKVRQAIREKLVQLRDRGGNAVVLYGTGELAEVIYLTIAEMGLSLAGVVDDDRSGGQFFRHPIRSLAELPLLPCDCLIVTALGPKRDALTRLFEAGVPEAQILILEQRGITIRAGQPRFTESGSEAAGEWQPVDAGA